MVRIASFNINGVNRRLPNLIAWLHEARPDIVCLQELKARPEDFPQDALRDAGYEAAWQGERSWNGVAILSRGRAPVVTRRRLPGEPDDLQARYVEAAVDGILVASIYLPNGNPQPGPKFDYKLRWFERLIAHAATLAATGLPVVLGGDYNVVPTDADIYPTRSWAKDALLQPQSRSAFQRLLAQGWTHALRTLHPTGPLYSYWDYKRERWPRDAGLLLDHLLLSPVLAGHLTDGGIDRAVRGEAGASDHAPVWIRLGPEHAPPSRR